MNFSGQSGVICLYLPFVAATIESPTSAKINKFYLVYVVSSAVLTILANLLMWYIYAADHYTPSFFAGWLGTIVAYVVGILPFIFWYSTLTLA